MKKAVLILALVLTGAGAFFHQTKFSEIPVWQVPRLLSEMRAKEFCSCHLILKFEREYCLKKVKKGYPIFGFSLDKEKQIVRFRTLFSEAEARVQSSRLGCRLN